MSVNAPSIRLDHADLCIFHYAVLYYAVLFVNPGVAGLFHPAICTKMDPPARQRKRVQSEFVSLAQ